MRDWERSRCVSKLSYHGNVLRRQTHAPVQPGPMPACSLMLDSWLGEEPRNKWGLFQHVCTTHTRTVCVCVFTQDTRLFLEIKRNQLKTKKNICWHWNSYSSSTVLLKILKLKVLPQNGSKKQKKEKKNSSECQTHCRRIKETVRNKTKSLESEKKMKGWEKNPNECVSTLILVTVLTFFSFFTAKATSPSYHGDVGDRRETGTGVHFSQNSRNDIEIPENLKSKVYWKKTQTCWDQSQQSSGKNVEISELGMSGICEENK